MILNEALYAQKLLNNEATDPKPFFALSILARYYYHKQHYRKKKSKQLLYTYLCEHYMLDGGQLLRWNDTIDKLVTNAKKYPLHEINGISITANEMATIDSVTGAAMKRLAFTALCLAKLGNLRRPKNNGWVNDSDRDVFKLANISCSALERQVKIGTLYKNGLFEFTKRNDDLRFRVTYIDNDSEEVMFVDDLRELGYQYVNYHEEGKYVKCSECGVYIKKQPGRKKPYCKNCATPSVNNKRPVRCMDCNNVFWISNMNRESKRCPFCYKEYRRVYMNKLMAAKYAKNS